MALNKNRTYVEDSVYAAYDNCLGPIDDYGVIPSVKGSGGLGQNFQTWSQVMEKIVGHVETKAKLSTPNAAWATRETLNVTLTAGIKKIIDEIVNPTQGAVA